MEVNIPTSIGRRLEEFFLRIITQTNNQTPSQSKHGIRQPHTPWQWRTTKPRNGAEKLPILILSYTYHTPSLRKSFKMFQVRFCFKKSWALLPGGKHALKDGLADAPPVRGIRLHLFEMPSKNTIHGSLDMFSPQHGSSTKSVPSDPGPTGSVEPDAMVL